jgi:hypothetical protein
MFSKVINVITALLSLALLLVPQISSANMQKNTYKSSTYKLSFKYPNDWKVSNDSGNTKENIEKHLQKTSTVVVVQSKNDPITKFDLQFNLKYETCEELSAASTEGKIFFNKKSIGTREWIIGKMVGSAYEATDSAFIACTTVKKSFSPFKSKKVLLVLLGYTFLPGSIHSSEYNEHLEKHGTEILATLSL